MPKKRLVICMDGTWQNLAWQTVESEKDKATGQAPDRRTNVAKIAQLTKQHAKDGTPQIVFYSPGVGARTYVNKDKEMRYAGVTGKGADEHIIAAYMFLSFNYEPGDDIFLFGFSRGAFCVRSLAGLVSRCGIVRRDKTQYVRNAIDLYRMDVNPDTDNMATIFRSEFSVAPVAGRDGTPLNAPNAIAVTYIGVFDTVVMNKTILEFLGLQKRREGRFHDLNLGRHVRAARHAIAIDERRNTLPVTPWTNLADFCRDANIDPCDPKAPYQQKFFCGAHGDVGGGQDRLLSAVSRKWILRGACDQGLEVDERMVVDGTPEKPAFYDGKIEKYESGLLARIGGLRDRVCYPETPDPNAARPWLAALFGKRPPPATIEALDQHVHVSAAMRMRYPDARYRPRTLRPFSKVTVDSDDKYRQWLERRAAEMWTPGPFDEPDNAPPTPN